MLYYGRNQEFPLAFFLHPFKFYCMKVPGFSNESAEYNEFLSQIPHIIKKLKSGKMNAAQRGTNHLILLHNSKLSIEVNRFQVKTIRFMLPDILGPFKYEIQCSALHKNGANNTYSKTLFWKDEIEAPHPVVDLYLAMKEKIEDNYRKQEEAENRKKLIEQKKSLRLIRSLGKLK